MSMAVLQGRQVEVDEAAADAAPIGEIERITGLRLEAVDQVTAANAGAVRRLPAVAPDLLQELHPGVRAPTTLTCICETTTLAAQEESA